MGAETSIPDRQGRQKEVQGVRAEAGAALRHFQDEAEGLQQGEGTARTAAGRAIEIVRAPETQSALWHQAQQPNPQGSAR